MTDNLFFPKVFVLIPFMILNIVRPRLELKRGVFIFLLLQKLICTVPQKSDYVSLTV